jgi:acyl carrier protein
VESRRARGLAGTSVEWGVWAGGGMAEADTTVQHRLGRGPLRPMDPALAVRALGQALESADGVVGLMDVDWVQSAASMGDPRYVPLLRELPDVLDLVPAAGPGAEPVALGELITRLAAQPPAEQDRILTDLVRAEVATVLGHDSADSIGGEQAFQDLGFDSLTAVELRNRLSMATGERLPATLIFDYPTPGALARFLKSELLPTLGGTEAADPADAEEAELRKVLTSVPLSLLRNAGLLESILALAGGESGEPAPDEESVSIADLDVADLIRIARDRSGTEDELL